MESNHHSFRNEFTVRGARHCSAYPELIPVAQANNLATDESAF